MKILVLCDDHYHPGQTVKDGLAPLKEKGYRFDFVDDGLDVKPEMLKDYSVVILSKCDEATPDNRVSWETAELQQAFVDYIENGGGIITIHCGLVSGMDTQVLHGLIGAKFKTHPNNSLVTVEAVKNHPVTEGVSQFTELDEHYYIELLADDVDILMASYSPPQGEVEKYETEPYFNYPAKIEPSCFVRTQGKGRSCVLASGHHLKVWHNPNFQRLLDNSLRWCAGKCQ